MFAFIRCQLQHNSNNIKTRIKNQLKLYIILNLNKIHVTLNIGIMIR